MAKNDNLMHVRLDYEGAKRSKKDLLMTEISVIKAVQTLHAYKLLKQQEYEEQEKLQEKIKETRLILLALQRQLPKVKVPKEFSEEIGHEEAHESSKEKPKAISRPRIIKIHEDPLQAQLREIQDKLSKLG